ncbi:hypothetical protein DID74_02585 [Candidatus Marinamargulisbacteria bacterium SCGC AG-333-B06]|nr:hypothetical protein DID74_02585 [Candidatus Marinamargulisbacteria bacterium SCGC AG-333-B06]
MKQTIKHIIFDIGNVLFKYNPTHIIECLMPQSKSKQFYLDNLFNSEYWQKLDRGDMSLTKVQSILKDKHNLTNIEENEIKTLVDNFTNHLILDNDMKNLFETLSHHFNIYILSNFQSKPFKQLIKKHSFLTKAQGIVVSADVMMKKPEIGIYHFLLSQYRLLPHESLFIDDMEENIKTAKKLLINPIHFKSYAQTIKDLQHYNITI